MPLIELRDDARQERLKLAKRPAKAALTPS